jgi:hypothetical protein
MKTVATEILGDIHAQEQVSRGLSRCGFIYRRQLLNEHAVKVRLGIQQPNCTSGRPNYMEVVAGI